MIFSIVFYFFLSLLLQIYQSWLDKSTPFYIGRWAGTLILTAVYMIRVYILQVTCRFQLFHSVVCNAMLTITLGQRWVNNLVECRSNKHCGTG
jgi:hypothetical protein